MTCDLMFQTVERDEESGWSERTWATQLTNVPCEVRGVIDGGLRLAGTTQVFDNIYQNVDWIKAQFPPDVNITNEMRITNVRGQDGKIIWRDEEVGEPDDPISGPATEFDVLGVNPTVDPFTNVITKHVLAKKTEVRSG